MSATDEQLLVLLARDVNAAHRKVMGLHARGYDVADVLNPLREAFRAAQALALKRRTPAG